MKKKDIIRQILISCGISVMISTTTSIVQNQLFIKKCNKAFEEINDDIEEIQSDINQLKQNDEEILADIKELREGYESLDDRLEVLESQIESLNTKIEVLENKEDKIFNDNLEILKMNTEISEKVEDEIRSAYSLNESDYLKGGDFIIALAVLDCEIYGENRKYVLSTFRRNDEYEILRGISNPEILIFGKKVNGEYVYYSLANNYLIINNIDTDVEKYFTYVERIANEEPSVSYDEIKNLENDLNNSNKLTRK